MRRGSTRCLCVVFFFLSFRMEGGEGGQGRREERVTRGIDCREIERGGVYGALNGDKQV